MTEFQTTAELVRAITATTNDQSTGIAEINTAMQHLQHVIQHNVSVSEQTASTAKTLAQQAGQLRSAIAFFTTHKPGAAMPDDAPQQ